MLSVNLGRFEATKMGMRLLVIHYFKHWLTATDRVLLFMAVVRMLAVAGLIVALNLFATLFTLKRRHSNLPISRKLETRNKYISDFGFSGLFVQ
jgi:hypothetical protein